MKAQKQKLEQVAADADLFQSGMGNVEPTKSEPTKSEPTKSEPGALVANLSAETVEAIADAFADKLVQATLPILLLHARLCAADTVHTTQNPDTVFRHAIKEAKIAGTEIKKYLKAENA